MVTATMTLAAAMGQQSSGYGPMKGNYSGRSNAPYSRGGGGGGGGYAGGVTEARIRSRILGHKLRTAPSPAHITVLATLSSAK